MVYSAAVIFLGLFGSFLILFFVCYYVLGKNDEIIDEIIKDLDERLKRLEEKN